MALDEIVSRIRQDAHTKAEARVAEAREEATRLRKEFEHELEQRKEALRRELEAGIQARVGMMLAGARREVRDAILSMKESLIRECIDTALDGLRTLSPDRKRELLLTLITAGRRQVGEPCRVSVTDEEDRELLRGATGFELAPETVPGSGGVVVSSPDGRLRVNNTLEGVLQRRRGEIRTVAARDLFT